MQILKNKYMRNLIVLIVFLFFFSEALESLSKGKTVFAVMEFVAAVAAVVLVIAKRRKDKRKDETEE